MRIDGFFFKSFIHEMATSTKKSLKKHCIKTRHFSSLKVLKCIYRFKKNNLISLSTTTKQSCLHINIIIIIILFMPQGAVRFCVICATIRQVKKNSRKSILIANGGGGVIT
jgi:hypothetical protein